LSEDKVRAAAVRAFAAIAPSERADEVIDELLPLLGSLDKVQAAQVFAALLPGDRAKVIEKLLSRLQSRDSDVQREVAVLLTKIPPGDRAKEVIENLFALLRESDIRLQLVAAGALAAIPPGERANEVIGKLLPLLVWPDSDVQREVAELLGKIPPGKRADLVIGKLLPLLESSTGSVRQAAAGALAAIPPGNRAKEAIGKLRPLFGSLNMDAQLAVAQTLLAIPLGDRSTEFIDILLQLVESSNMNKSVEVKEAIAAIPLGDRINELIDKLLARLEVPDRNMEWAAARVFAVIPPGERAKEVIAKLLPLLGSSDINVQWAAARAFAAIPPGDRAKEVIGKLLPLLSSSDENIQNAAAWALAQAGPGDARTAIAILGDIHNQAATATPTLRAVAHIATGADAKNEGSEVLLAWLGDPLKPPVETIANDPAAAHAVLETLDRYWHAIAANAGLRREAEGRVIDILDAACRTPAESNDLSHWVRIAFAWIRDLPLQGLVQRCWTSEQRRTLEQLLDGFQDAGYKDLLNARLARENPAPILQWLSWGAAGWITLWTAFLFAFPWSRTFQAVFFWNPKVRNMLSLWFVPLLLLCLPPCAGVCLSRFTMIWSPRHTSGTCRDSLSSAIAAHVSALTRPPRWKPFCKGYVALSCCAGMQGSARRALYAGSRRVLSVPSPSSPLAIVQPGLMWQSHASSTTFKRRHLFAAWFMPGR
jgi:HEAT repeat protein